MRMNSLKTDLEAMFIDNASRASRSSSSPKRNFPGDSEGSSPSKLRRQEESSKKDWGPCRLCKIHRPGSWKECPECRIWVGAGCHPEECWNERAGMCRVCALKQAEANRQQDRRDSPEYSPPSTPRDTLPPDVSGGTSEQTHLLLAGPNMPEVNRGGRGGPDEAVQFQQ